MQTEPMLLRFGSEAVREKVLHVLRPVTQA
jgi:hypothetical protein